MKAPRNISHSYSVTNGAQSQDAGSHVAPADAVMVTLSALVFEYGLPDLPVLLIEPHRNRGGVWRIKFSYETDEPFSMSAVQASAMASRLHAIGEVELAEEIDSAIKSASRYASM
jgi:hypothetical protein